MFTVPFKIGQTVWCNVAKKDPNKEYCTGLRTVRCQFLGALCFRPESESDPLMAFENDMYEFVVAQDPETCNVRDKPFFITPWRCFPDYDSAAKAREIFNPSTQSVVGTVTLNRKLLGATLIREIRFKFRFSYAQIATLIGKTSATLFHWANKKHAISLKNEALLRAILAKKPEDFVDSD